jgi:DNA-binding NarL/FixJ family response regulator
MTATRHSRPEISPDTEQATSTPSEPPRHPSGVHRATRPRAAWTVAEKFVRDGFRYRLMRQPIEASEAGPRLAPREEQVLMLACNGDNNKQIAEALGLAASTVGVLLFRAGSKFGVKTRQELLAAYQQARYPSSPPDSCDDDES